MSQRSAQSTMQLIIHRVSILLLIAVFVVLITISETELLPRSREYKRFNATMRRLIVHLHNYYRNKIATGQMPEFERAKRMATMVSTE